jgi:hypothetical protein
MGFPKKVPFGEGFACCVSIFKKKVCSTIWELFYHKLLHNIQFLMNSYMISYEHMKREVVIDVFLLGLILFLPNFKK